MPERDRQRARLACLRAPLFPLAARLRTDPELISHAIAIFAGNGNSARLIAATRPARRAGVRPGMTLPQARALVPKLTAFGRDEECERAAQEALLELAESFSPRIEDAGDGTVFLDITGLELHFPGNSFELDLAAAIDATAHKLGLVVWIGIASSKLAARIGAEQSDSPTIVRAGEEARFLAPLPLARLTPEAEIAATLGRWGIRTVGEFVQLPRNEVSSRLGQIGSDLHLQARGIDPQPLVPYQPPADFQEGMELEWPLMQLEPFLFVARSALDRLCKRLDLRGLGCAAIRCSLRLDPEGYHERVVQLPAPTRDPKTLLTLIRLDLEAQPPGAPVVGFTLSARPDQPRQAQLSLLGPEALAPDQLAATLARLFALLGPDRVGSPREVDGHRPERFELVEYAPPPPPRVRPESDNGTVREGCGLLVVRSLRPPIPLEVITDSTASDRIARPLEVSAVVTDQNAQRPRIQGAVKVASGPWALEEEWWSEEAVSRDYWDIEGEGGIYRIFRQRETGDWFVDGIYD